MKVLKKMIVIVLATVLLGCASSNTIHFGSIDTNEKTISAPPGTKGIVGPLKQVLFSEGWMVDEYDLQPTRYKLVINTVRAQLVCWNEFSEISYEVFLVDTSTGREIFVISGDDCDDFSKASTAFRNALKKAN